MHDRTATLSDYDHSLFRSDVVEGLSRLQKIIPCRWLYEERGSELFEEITRLEEYYPTRAETAILRLRQPELRQFAGPGDILIEYGAGAEAWNGAGQPGPRRWDRNTRAPRNAPALPEAACS